MNTGKLIVFEGPDACGKSTMAESLFRALRAAEEQVVIYREPGATPEGERIREILLDKGLESTPIAKTMLFCAARAQLVNKKVIPALDNGAHVVLDRFSSSTWAYQGIVMGVGLNMVKAIDEFACQGLVPDMVIVLDVDPAVAQARMPEERQDWFDNQGIEFHVAVRNAYLGLARGYDWPVVDGNLTVSQVLANIMALVEPIL